MKEQKNVSLYTGKDDEQQGFSDGWSHKELVTGLKALAEKKGRIYYPGKEYDVTYEYIMREEFEWQSRHPTRLDFFHPLLRAWDVTAIDRYNPRGVMRAASDLSWYRKPPVELFNPLQVKIIDALTDIYAIPHKKGQTIFEIPEKFRGRNYMKWGLEYEKTVYKPWAEEQEAKDNSQQPFNSKHRN